MELNEKVFLSNVLSYLSVRSCDKSLNLDTENADVGIQCLAEAFQLNAQTQQELQLTNKTCSMLDIFTAGIKALKIEMPTMDTKSSVEVATKTGEDVTSQDTVVLEHPEMWQKWLDKLDGKGYFKGAVKGTDEYSTRVTKALGKFKEKFAPVDEFKDLSQEEREEQAEGCKGEGNAAMSAEDFDGAVRHYEKALVLSKTGAKSHIYHANLAAALTHLKNYDQVIQHCEAAIELNPKYVKSFSRMGHAHYCQNDFDASIQSYRQGLEVDSTNEACIEGLEQAELKKNAMVSRQDTPSTPAAGGMPDLSSLAGLMGGAGGAGGGGMADMMAGLMGGAGGAGGAGGLAAMMQNPAMRDMAANMMQNPQMMAMAQNVMSNPDMMANMMNGMGGGGAPPGAPSSTSNIEEAE